MKKAFTDLEQSKKLAEILPLESADMWWAERYKGHIGDNGEYVVAENPYYYLSLTKPSDTNYSQDVIHDIPCYSLAALIEVLPVDWWGYNEHYFLEISKMGDASKPNEVRYFRFRKEIDGANYDRITHISHSAENLVDACVNMIITLHDHKLLSIK